ncbi:hypothetical protein GQ457_18G012870 [Hibiscus cannabinus]
MYRTAANRLLHHASLIKNNGGSHLRRLPVLGTVITSSRFSTTADLQTSPNQTFHPSDSSTSSSTVGDDSRQGSKNTRAEYVEAQARVLQASLRHVIKFGWSEEVMIAGAKEVGVSPSIVGSFPRKEETLVEFFMDDSLQRLIHKIVSGEELQQLIPSQRISKLAHPMNGPTSFKQRAMLDDEIWHAAGDEASDIDWHVKRTFLGGIYSTTEIYMLIDRSPKFCDTWLFLDDRATYLAEAVGAGMGSSLQGFAGKVFQR